MKTTKKKLVLKKKTIAQLTDFTIGNKNVNQIQGAGTRLCIGYTNDCVMLSRHCNNNELLSMLHKKCFGF